MKLNQQGQTLILTTLVMISALLVGITISTRFITGLRTLVATDDATKATGTAEALVERLLLVPDTTLQSYITNNNCGSECTLQITDTNGQSISATATLSLVGNTSNSYPISAEEQEVASVSLSGYTTNRLVYVCWDGTTSLTGYYIYQQSGVIKATPFAYNAVLAEDTTNGFSSSTSNFGYDNCFSVTASQTPLMLRLISLYGRTDMYILPEPGYTIPIQGIQIVSAGTAGNSLKKVTVIKSAAFAPAYFDYVLFQKTWDDSLSN